MAKWKKNLDAFFSEKEEPVLQEEKSELNLFISEVVMTAFSDIARNLESHSRDVVIRESENTAVIVVNKEGEEELSYRIQTRMFPNGLLPFAEVRFRERGGHRLLTVESNFRVGQAEWSLSDVTSNEIIEHFVENYTSRVQIG